VTMPILCLFLEIDSQPRQLCANIERMKEVLRDGAEVYVAYEKREFKEEYWYYKKTIKLEDMDPLRIKERLRLAS
jgi:hypothetical protein